MLECVEVQTGEGRPAWSVVWLHGLGADGHDFEPIVPELRLPASPAVRFVFPHAPHRAVTINNGMVMRAWYDMLPGPNGFTSKLDDIADSARHIGELIAREHERGIAGENVILAGFSQGGAVALYAGLRFPTVWAVWWLCRPICPRPHRWPANAARPTWGCRYSWLTAPWTP